MHSQDVTLYPRFTDSAEKSFSALSHQQIYWIRIFDILHNPASTEEQIKPFGIERFQYIYNSLGRLQQKFFCIGTTNNPRQVSYDPKVFPDWFCCGTTLTKGLPSFTGLDCSQKYVSRSNELQMALWCLRVWASWNDRCNGARGIAEICKLQL